MKKIKFKQNGAVSLFVVIFTALLMTVVTVSFVRIMLQDQKQATSTDLSQSAYDSAQAGVEDAKRALLLYQSICNSYGHTSTDCIEATKAINSTECNESVSILKDIRDIVKEDGVNIETGSNDTKLNQSYSCLKINLNTPDYLGELKKDESKVIPLIGEKYFDTVQIDWFNNVEGRIKLYPLSTYWPLVTTDWGADNPPILRSQFIQFAESFRLNDFDYANSNTLFLYPFGQTGVSFDSVGSVSNTKDISLIDFRRTPTGKPTPIRCSGTISNGSYACSAKIKLSNPANYVDGGGRELYLNLASINNQTNYRVSLYDSSPAVPELINFHAVQPQIDSTGRASTLYRRVATRVEMTDINFSYPEAAINLTGNFCKDFSITDNPNDFNHDSSDSSVGKCTP